MRVGFFVNPLAGYGIVSNRKGSDGLVLASYKDSRSVVMAVNFLKKVNSGRIDFLVPSGIMGSSVMEMAGIHGYEVIYDPGETTTANDTRNFIRNLLEKEADLVVFVGGDGTARDVLSVAGDRIPVFGIPAGMKMYSSVFAISVSSAVSLIRELSFSSSIDTRLGEVVDIDEEKFRDGVLDISLYGEMKVPVTPLVVSQAKAEYTNVDITGISEYISEKMNSGTRYIIGPGSTCKSVLPEGVRSGNLLGFDILVDGRIVKEDADEKTIYEMSVSGGCILIISPLGGQNFLLGRGNRQISSRVVENIGWNNIWVIASQEKIREMANLYVDVDNSKEIHIPEFVKVLYGYGRYRMVPVRR